MREFLPLTKVIEPDFIHFVAEPRHWKVTEEVTFLLPGYDFRDIVGNYYCASPGRLTVFAGYRWDGASGFAADTPDVWICSLIHDIASTRIKGKRTLPSYIQRHNLYARIMWMQRPRPACGRGLWKVVDTFRPVCFAALVAIHWSILMAVNWAWSSTPLNDIPIDQAP